MITGGTWIESADYHRDQRSQVLPMETDYFPQMSLQPVYIGAPREELVGVPWVIRPFLW